MNIPLPQCYTHVEEYSYFLHGSPPVCVALTITLPGEPFLFHHSFGDASLSREQRNGFLFARNENVESQSLRKAIIELSHPWKGLQPFGIFSQ
jgi:hypothetical protein